MERKQTIKSWTKQFYDYWRATDIKQAARKIWDEWQDNSNIYFPLLPNPEALMFSLLAYTPPRGEGTTVANTPKVIQWDDAPIYDTISSNWYDLDIWNCADWQMYHQALEEHYKSTNKANLLWKSAWLHEDNYCFITGIAVCPNTSYCRYDCDFVEYLASKGMEVGQLVSNIYCDLSSVVLNVTEAAENATDGINQISKYAPYVVGGTLLLAGGAKLLKSI